jgi:glycosyltransferase involved in cell wall biosynthesis
MRVMHVIEAMHQGGAESLVIEHVRHAGRGVESWVCALNRGGPALDQAAALGARTEVLRRGRGAIERAAGLGRLMSRLRELRIDVINGHNPTGALFGTIAGSLVGVPVIVRTEHSIHYAARHSRLYRGMERWMTARSSAVICVCDAVRASHAPRFAGLETRFVTIANGIGPEPTTRARDDVRRELGIATDVPLALTVGSLTPQKAQHVLIEAMAELKRLEARARLAIAGEGTLRLELEARIRELDLGGSVSLLGARGDVADLMRAADVFVLPSEREGLSITLLESMRAAIPAVATRVGGNAEAVDDGVTGTLVPVQDAAALARAIARLFEDAPRREAMGRAAEARWRERFTASRMVLDTERLYERERVAKPFRTPQAVRGSAA